METTPRNLFFFELCRLCLENAGTREVFETSNLLEDIFDCTGVTVSHSDNLPHKICVKCAEVVAKSKELRIVASKNDVHLRTLFGGVKDYEDSEDNVQSHTHSTQGTPSKSNDSGCPEVISNYFDNSPDHNNRNSSKNKLSLLLKEGDENNCEASPIIRQTVSLRKDLFPHSSSAKSQSEDDLRLLKVKVETEIVHSKNMKMSDGDDEDIEFICGVCCKSFDKHKKLYLHQRLHNKKFICSLDACGKKFATKGDLEKHLRTHTGEKPFQCKICDRGFTQRVSLRAHVTSVHGKEVKEAKEEVNENGSVLQSSPRVMAPEMDTDQ